MSDPEFFKKYGLEQKIFCPLEGRPEECVFCLGHREEHADRVCPDFTYRERRIIEEARRGMQRGADAVKGSIDLRNLAGVELPDDATLAAAVTQLGGEICAKYTDTMHLPALLVGMGALHAAIINLLMGGTTPEQVMAMAGDFLTDTVTRIQEVVAEKETP